MTGWENADGPLWGDLCPTQPDLERTVLSILHRTVFGHQAAFAHSGWALTYQWLTAYQKRKVVEILTSGLHWHRNFFRYDMRFAWK
jgi:hypothetical protein